MQRRVSFTLWTSRVTLAGGLLVTSASPARGQAPMGVTSPEPTDEELIARGIELRKEGRDAEALAQFEHALDLHPSARARAQIALAHEALGHWRDAERGVIAVLSDPGDPWVVSHRVYLEDSLAALQEHLAWLEVESNVVGTEVRVGGEMAGRLPLDGPIRVVSGPLVVEVRAPGYAAIQRTLAVGARSRVHEEFTFVGPPVAEKRTTDEPRAPAWAPPRAPGGEATRGVRTAGWAALATAGGFLLAGVAGAVIREREAQIYDDDSRCGPLGGESRYDRCATNRNIGSTAETLATVSFIASGAAAAVSGALLLGRWEPAPARTAKAVGCRMVGLGIACGSAF